MAVVLKQFPWSHNGYDVEILNPGNERNFGAALEGLAAEGFVVGGDAEPAPEPVVEQEPVVDQDVAVETETTVKPEVPVEPAIEPEVTPEHIVEPAPEPVRQPRKRK